MKQRYNALIPRKIKVVSWMFSFPASCEMSMRSTVSTCKLLSRGLLCTCLRYLPFPSFSPSKNQLKYPLRLDGHIVDSFV